MTPISALAILFCIYAVSELIAQKTKAIFSTVLSIAILLLAGFWSDILPRTLIDDAQITGFGNIIAGLLIVSLGTTIDFAELRRQWKVVITALCGVCGAVASIVLIGRPFIGSEMAIAGAPIFAGGSAATLIMTSTLKEMNLTTAATFCIVLYVTQKFIGVPIASLLLRRTASSSAMTRCSWSSTALCRRKTPQRITVRSTCRNAASVLRCTSPSWQSLRSSRTMRPS